MGSAITVAASVVSFIGSLFGKKPWTYRLVALVNRQAMSGFFTVLAYLNRTDRIQYWFNLITTTKGIGIDDGPNYLHQLHLETVKLAIGAGISTAVRYPSFSAGSIAQTLYEKGYSNPIADDGSWSIPADLIPSTTQTQQQTQQQAQQQVQTAQASIVPSSIGSLIPVLAIGGVAFLVAKKMRVI